MSDKYIIQQAAKGNGWSVTRYQCDGLVAVGTTAAEAVAAAFDTAPVKKLTPDELARHIVLCAPTAGANKINMIKLQRSITGQGLKDAKDAIENAMAQRASDTRWGY